MERKGAGYGTRTGHNPGWTEREIEFCFIPEPRARLKPGVSPHRPYRHGSPSVDVPGVGRIVGRKPDVVPPTSESVPPSKPDVVPPKPAVNQPGARNVNVGGNNTGIINVGDDATIETGDKFPLCDG